MEDATVIILLVITVVIIAAVCVWESHQTKKYMSNQKETGADKRKVLDVMEQVLKEKLDDYDYVVGNYTKTERYGRSTTYYYFSYILAFNEREMVVYPFVVKDKQVLLRNCVAINWETVKFSYKLGKKAMDMTFDMAGEKLIINVLKVQESTGKENSSEPLGIYQEAEVEKLISYLPSYKTYSRR